MSSAISSILSFLTGYLGVERLPSDCPAIWRVPVLRRPVVPRATVLPCVLFDTAFFTVQPRTWYVAEAVKEELD